MSLYAIWDNLYSFLVKGNQNLKFLHWASIVIGNRPVSALHALLLQYLLTPSNHFNNLLWTVSGWSLSGSVIQDHSDHCASKEPTNPWPEWIHRFFFMLHDPSDLGWLIGIWITPKSNIAACSNIVNIYYTSACGPEFYLRMVNSISHEWGHRVEH